MYSNILVPVDPTHVEVADRLIEVANKLVSDGGSITVVSIIEPLPAYVQGYLAANALTDTIAANKNKARETLEQLQTKVSGTSHALLDEGHPPSEILRLAKEGNMDLIILGSHRPALKDYMLGSTAARVVRHAECSVIVERSVIVRQ